MRAHTVAAGLVALCGAALGPDAAFAHASDQGLVLLLPTDAYVAAGVAAVAATVLLLALVPARLAESLFRPVRLAPRPFGLARARRLSGLLAFAVFAALLWAGATGNRDPMENPLPLVVWTVWWVGVVLWQGLVGDLWRWINPFGASGAVLARATGWRAPLRYPRRLGHGPALLGFLGFAAVLLADPAPVDPGHLARIAGGYWLLTLFGLALFGPRWLLRGEALTVLMRSYARVAPLVRGRAGLWGWQLLHGPVRSTGAAVFVLLMLGSGSFDGLNETFWWLALIGVNPLEFPGRSAVVLPTLTGLALANLALIAVYAAAVQAGLWLAGGGQSLGAAFCRFAPAILPIALGYHLAHYLGSLLIDGQYVLSWLSEAAGLGQVHVTAGFMNRLGSVRLIWLTEAGAVVGGHVVSVVLAHALAVRAYGDTRRAALSQGPLAAFMVLYTLFGLWLLAAPRGL